MQHRRPLPALLLLCTMRRDTPKRNPAALAHQPLALGRLLATLERRSQWLEDPMLKVREYDWPAQTWSLVIVVVPDLITKLIALREREGERGSQGGAG